MQAKPGRIYDQIYQVVRQIATGRVASYGQVARIVGRCTARMVGYAMAASGPEHDIPWHRVINSQGKISPHGFGYGSAMQRKLLEAEGVIFDDQDRVDFDRFGWSGPGG